MNPWSKFVQSYLDAHQMKPADLARKSGVSPQVLSVLLNDPRTQLIQRPEQRTIELLAAAMGVGPEVLLSKVGEAMGLPVNEPVVVYDATGVSNEDLLRALADRLDVNSAATNSVLYRRTMDDPSEHDPEVAAILASPDFAPAEKLALIANAISNRSPASGVKVKTLRPADKGEGEG